MARDSGALASSPGAPVSDRHRAGARNPHRRRPPRQSHGCEPTHRQPRRIAPTWSAGQFSRWGPPTGIARERETRTDNAAPRQSHGCEPTHRQPRRIAPTAWSAGQFSRSAGLRPASRGSAKPAAMTPSPASVSATPPFSCGRGERADPIMWVSPGGGRHRYPKRSETASCWTPGCFRRKNPVPRPRRAAVRPA